MIEGACARPQGPYRVSWMLDGQLDGIATAYESLREALQCAFDTALRMGPTIRPGSEWTGCRVEGIDTGEIIAVYEYEGVG